MALLVALQFLVRFRIVGCVALVKAQRVGADAAWRLGRRIAVARHLGRRARRGRRRNTSYCVWTSSCL